MQNWKRLKGIEQSDAEKLIEAGITDFTMLWQQIGKNFTDGISQVAKKLNIEEDQLINILISRGKYEASKSGGTWIITHWFDILIFGILVFIFGSVLGMVLFNIFLW